MSDRHAIAYVIALGLAAALVIGIVRWRRARAVERRRRAGYGGD